MLTKPGEMATAAGMAMLVFDQLQNQTSLWDSLLIIPKILSSSSVDQGTDNVKTLLISVQGYVPTVMERWWWWYLCESFSAHKPGDSGTMLSSIGNLVFVDFLHINLSFKKHMAALWQQ